MRYIVCTLLITLLYAAPAFSKSQASCAKNTATKNCFNVRGQLSYYANMRPRLQTEKKLFGIAEKANGTYNWPEDLEKRMSADMVLSGDFYVCPVTPSYMGTIGTVCIGDAANVQETQSSHSQTER